MLTEAARGEGKPSTREIADAVLLTYGGLCMAEAAGVWPDPSDLMAFAAALGEASARLDGGAANGKGLSQITTLADLARPLASGAAREACDRAAQLVDTAYVAAGTLNRMEHAASSVPTWEATAYEG